LPDGAASSTAGAWAPAFAVLRRPQRGDEQPEFALDLRHSIGAPDLPWARLVMQQPELSVWLLPMTETDEAQPDAPTLWVFAEVGGEQVVGTRLARRPGQLDPARDHQVGPLLLGAAPDWVRQVELVYADSMSRTTVADGLWIATREHGDGLVRVSINGQ